jgi:hypothetical protein
VEGDVAGEGGVSIVVPGSGPFLGRIEGQLAR